MKKLILSLVAVGFAMILIGASTLFYISSNLPKIVTVEDYHPLLVSEVYDRNGQKMGEFFREKRTLLPFKDIPPMLVNAFIAAEDDQFYEHSGINYVSIFRAFIANLRAGRKVQGGSTITQQTAKSILLSPEKTIIRKIKEAILATRMEAHLSKEDILYLYLNQIYFGQGAYGVQEAAKTYFRKDIKNLSLGEMAILAGLPKAPSRFSPTRNPKRAKQRQNYVLGRMAATGFISEEQAKEEKNTPISVYVRENFQETAPFYLETVRQILVKELGESQVLDKGLRIYTSLDLEKQKAAQEEVQKGLRHLDKRQGYRGSKKHIKDPLKYNDFLVKERKRLLLKHTPERVILADGTTPLPAPLDRETNKDENGKPLANIPPYIKLEQIIHGVITDIDDDWGLVFVQIPEGKGLIDFATMKWARKPNPNIRFDRDEIEKPSQALKVGDVIQVRLLGEKFYSVEINKRLKKLKQSQKEDYKRPEELPEFKDYIRLALEQEPIAEGALISFDQKTQDILAMVGGYSFKKSQFNRTIQAVRQTGSSFKSLVYAAALDKNYTPATPIIDAPIVHSDVIEEGQGGEAIVKKWKPLNHSKKFSGDILFRNALIRSKNVPTIKITENIGIDWITHYARRLGIFNPLNPDLTIGLGTSGITLYEMTKVFAHFGRMGKRIRPLIIHRVENRQGETLVENTSLDIRFQEELQNLEEQYEDKRQLYLAYQKKLAEEENNPQETSEKTNEIEELNDDLTEDEDQILSLEEIKKLPPLFFENPEQILKPSTAYLITSVLHGAIAERGGTGGLARSLGRTVAGKTGSTSNYYDAWFIGYSPQVATGVWVGFDDERSLGKSEVGGRSALPIWVGYMKAAHENVPNTPFPVPEDIIFANIDNETGQLATAKTKTVIRQAFVEGTEPQTSRKESSKEDEEASFYKDDL